MHHAPRRLRPREAAARVRYRDVDWTQSNVAIGRQVGVHPTVVRRYRHRHGFPVMKSTHPWQFGQSLATDRRKA